MGSEPTVSGTLDEIHLHKKSVPRVLKVGIRFQRERLDREPRRRNFDVSICLSHANPFLLIAA